jgi:hypothetical protein
MWDASARGASHERRPLRAWSFKASSVFAIRKSSSFCPDWSAATSHRGCLPRPDHVSDGADGLQYFGSTFGYFRRGRSALAEELSGSLTWSDRLSCAKRFSSSCFSAVIFFARIFVSSSCKSQSSSKSIASNSNLPIAVSSLFGRLQFIREAIPATKRCVFSERPWKWQSRPAKFTVNNLSL